MTALAKAGAALLGGVLRQSHPLHGGSCILRRPNWTPNNGLGARGKA